MTITAPGQSSYFRSRSRSMIEQMYSLVPFPNASIPAIEVKAHARRENGLLHIQYRLTGETWKIRLPDTSKTPGRKVDLWSNTCFEFFLALPDDPQYWEFNLSPSGDWNAFRMDAYRQVGFQEETLVKWLQLETWKEAGSITLDASVELSPLIPENRPLQLGISSVIEGVDQHKTYWSLVHPRPQPDFHVRESFIIHI
jgi:hypothetical protein